SVQSDYNSVTLEDHLGNIWFGTSLGVDILQASNGRFLHLAADKKQPGSLSNENIYSLLEDSRKRMWVGTRDGLNLYLPESRSFLSFTRKDGLPDNTIINILEDNQGSLWVSTHNGLSQIKVSGYGKAVTLSCRNFTELNNLQGRDFNENAALKTSRGELIFGGANGFNIFQPTTLAGAPTSSEVRFTGFDLFNNPVRAGEAYNGRIVLPQSITTTREVTLAYNQNVFSVEFAALDFAHTEQTRFAYRLEGFNPDWLYTDAGIRKAHYTNLNPGLYRLHVRAFDNGHPGAQEAVLTIRILPPWWYSTPAYIAYAVLLIALLLAARKLILIRARARFQLEQERREARRMHELDELKIEFITNISHEFRTPLSLILAPLEKLQQHPATAEQQKQYGLMQRNVKRLLNLVNQLLDFRKLDVQELQLDTQPGDLISFTREVCAGFAEVAGRKHISFEFSSNLLQLPARFDPDKLEKVLLNLLSNAYKFTRDGGKVAVTIRAEETELGSLNAQTYCVIEIEDSGIGIEAKDLPLVFKRFHRNSLPENIVNPGSGIGLALVKEFVELHGGTVTVTSEPGKGSCFTVSLPVHKEGVEMKADEAPPPPFPEAAALPDTTLTGNRPGNRPLVLVVEDHIEFRNFLMESLQEHYRVQTAENGAEAWSYLQQHKPDLVISDVMMPVMDGLELAAKMKRNPATATIPLLLLTARNTEEHQLEGLMTGANDYIVKPFRFELLLQKIRNQLKEQRRKPVNQITVSTTEPAAPTADADWLQQLLREVETHIGDAGFSVEQLARQLHLSRAGLYKKLMTLTGKTPIAFIMEVRLSRACQLLKQRQLTVAEVAYEVGFSDPKYFSRTFKKARGVLPSAYAQTHAGDQPAVEPRDQDTVL
ncbi:MAG TPA: response regulator, partial [Flavisolibacter sp.]|nr:response regulator [Flavisolibacter sp.]